jgi:hypothetical protein
MIARRLDLGNRSGELIVVAVALILLAAGQGPFHVAALGAGAPPVHARSVLGGGAASSADPVAAESPAPGIAVAQRSSASNVTVNFTTIPATCGSIIFNGTAYTNGESLQVPPGTYLVGANPCAGTYLSGLSAGGGVHLSGSSALVTGSGLISATFATTYRLYHVTFNETPPDSTSFGWSVTLNGTTLETYGTSITFQEPNGTYNFTVGLPYSYELNRSASQLGPVTLAGRNQTVQLVIERGFNGTTYPITFKESGLASGTWWWVNLNFTSANFTNGIRIGSNTSSILFHVPNGSYVYLPVPSGNYQYPHYANLTVQGAGQTVLVNFTSSRSTNPPSYWVTFNESGLPSGMTWSVFLNETSGTAFWTLKNTTSGTGGIQNVFTVGNGSYDYSIGSVSGYNVSPKTGQVMVNGSGRWVELNFSLAAAPAAPEFSVLFVESGLPIGTSWSVVLNGSSRSSTGTSISFSVPNGTYHYVVDAVSGYVISPASGTLVVAGLPLYPGIAFGLLSGPSRGNPQPLDSYSAAVGVGVAVIALAVAVVALASRRSSPRAPSGRVRDPRYREFTAASEETNGSNSKGMGGDQTAGLPSKPRSTPSSSAESEDLLSDLR